MTNREAINALSDKELAVILICVDNYETQDYDLDYDFPIINSYTSFITSDGECFDRGDYDLALEHEIEWLIQEYSKKIVEPYNE